MKVLVWFRRIRQLESMVSTSRKIAGFLLLVVIGQLAAAGPSSDWTTATPEEVGLDSAALGAMMDYVREHEVPVHSVQIVRHGRLVLDAY